MPTNIRSLLTKVTADRKLTADAWTKVLAPALEKLPKTASPEARRLLDLWASDTFTVDDNARAGIRNFLRSRGYPVPYQRDPGVATLASDIARKNVSEPDADFARLSLAASRTGGKVTVAILDTGFDLGHPELTPRTWTNPGEIAGNGIDDDKDGKIDDVHGWNFEQQSTALRSSMARLTSHGTYSAGVATAGTDRIKQIACTVPLAEGSDAKSIAAAIDFAAGKGAKVVNMSFFVMDKTPSSNVPGRVAIVKAAMARHPEILFVVAAGNSGANSGGDPGAELGKGAFTAANFLAANKLPNLVVVAAADDQEHRPDYSNFGTPWVTVAAQADHYSPDTGESYLDVRPGGTSLAAPAATNVAAKCLALDPSLKAAELKALLTVTSDVKPDWQGVVEANGVLNATRAMSLAALRSLVKAGAAPEEAATRLKLVGAERLRLLGELKGLLPATIKPRTLTTPG